MRRDDARLQARGRRDTRLSQPEIENALPREDGTVRVRIEDGRGDAQVTQQPSRDNDYTAVVRVRDRSGGADFYRVSAYWVGADNGWGYGRGRDGDERDDRDRNGGNGAWGRDRDRGYRSVLHWSGRVDDALEIRVQGDQIRYRNLSGKGTRDIDTDFAGYGLPRENVELRVVEREGRGSVRVVQQPSARNNYTALIRIYDPRPSYGYYNFDVTWRNGYAWGR